MIDNNQDCCNLLMILKITVVELFYAIIYCFHYNRSKYMQMLPPLPIHCVALDGETATMPVIFEDQYQDPFEFEKRNCEGLSLTSQEGMCNFLKI